MGAAGAAGRRLAARVAAPPRERGCGRRVREPRSRGGALGTGRSPHLPALARRGSRSCGCLRGGRSAATAPLRSSSGSGAGRAGSSRRRRRRVAPGGTEYLSAAVEARVGSAFEGLPRQPALPNDGAKSPELQLGMIRNRDRDRPGPCAALHDDVASPATNFGETVTLEDATDLAPRQDAKPTHALLRSG